MYWTCVRPRPSVHEPVGLSRNRYLREESIPAADVFVTAEAVAGLAADVPPAALYLDPAAEADPAPPSLWPCDLASL